MAQAAQSFPSAVVLSTRVLGSSSGTSSSTGLSAGTIMVTGPNAGPSTLMAEGSTLPGYYFGILPAGFLTTSGGTFLFSATAGTQVGAFTTQVVFPTPLLQWTNQAASATVTRSAGLPITWTGGSPGTYVSITGTSSNCIGDRLFHLHCPGGRGTIYRAFLRTGDSSGQHQRCGQPERRKLLRFHRVLWRRDSTTPTR